VFAAVKGQQAQAGGQHITGGMQVGSGVDQVIEEWGFHGNWAWVVVRVRRCRVAANGAKGIHFKSIQNIQFLH
jgi:hypothetical protein